MRKNKKQDQSIILHSRNPSIKKQRTSQPRLSMQPSPNKILSRNPSSHFLSNPNSLQKKKPKLVRKKCTKPKKKTQDLTLQTVQSTSEGKWKEHLKLTFRSKKVNTKEISLHNTSLKCMEEIGENTHRKPAQSYSSLVTTFPKQKLTTTILSAKERVFLIDWIIFVSAELLCRRNTYHIAVAFIDNYLDKNGTIPAKLQALGAGALLLAVKQEQRGLQTYVLNILSGKSSGLTRQQIIKAESNIVVCLQFKLNFNTLPFWCDYFCQKWDSYITNFQPQTNLGLSFKLSNLILLRSPEGRSYQYYRQVMQLTDALLMHFAHRKFNFTELSLAVLYFVTRIETESSIGGQQSKTLYQEYFSKFSRKASPIFNDPLNFNAFFNQFTTQVCNFEITNIIPAIKWVAQFLNIGFTYQIDSRAYQSSVNYEEFLRFSNYSEHIRNYFLQKVL